ncbi:hypothetical protein ACFY8K_32960 [Streptomyces misionensis]|uniref:hypothetical protein n=1 Tax=Streptomyces misionensis TaxID=67331 RepID=UPI0036C0B7A3
MTRRPAPETDRAPLSPGYAIPPPLFPATPVPRPPAPAPAPVVVPPRHRRARGVDGAFVSGVLTLFSLASLLVAIAVVAV